MRFDYLAGLMLRRAVVVETPLLRIVTEALRSVALESSTADEHFPDRLRIGQIVEAAQQHIVHADRFIGAQGFDHRIGTADQRHRGRAAGRFDHAAPQAGIGGRAGGHGFGDAVGGAVRTAAQPLLDGPPCAVMVATMTGRAPMRRQAVGDHDADGHEEGGERA
ncbi:MAG: hypothetical protein U5M50_16065 [Sphingobium sp.]|nr:hypothetical protein [Sphingobium sp.]